MILNNLYIVLNREKGEFTSEIAYQFLKKTRHLCNFIARECLLKIKFRTNGFSRLVITLSAVPEQQVWVNSSNVLCLQLYFNQDEYKSLKKVEEYDEYFIKILQNGLMIALENGYFLPLDEINHAIKIFRNNGYKNEWVHKKKINKLYKIIASLKCELTIDNFFLNLCLHKGNILIYKKELLTLEPDEIAFHYRFKDLIFVDNKLVVTSKHSENLFTLNLDQVI